jgi:hypothetical protein
MAINLSRNTKVFFTTNVTAATGVISEGALAAASTFEIQVLDGYSFSQATTQSTIQISEAGDKPSRGQRAFNTALEPVDFTFSTYIRPNKIGDYVSPAERVLWNALFGEATIVAGAGGLAISSLTRASTSTAVATLVTPSAIQRTVNGTATAAAVGDVVNIQGFAGIYDTYNDAVTITAITAFTYTVEYSIAPLAAATSPATTTASTLVYAGQFAPGTAYSYVTSAGSNKNVLQKFGLIFLVDQVAYAIDNCAMDSVSVDFGLDAIAMCAWSGKGTTLRKINNTRTTLTSGTTSTVANSNAAFITNKLSTMTLGSVIGGSDATGSVAYTIPITGGNITIANNITYQVPVNLAVVNKPIGYYTGQRSITGNVTAYLRTGGSDDSGALLNAQLTAGVEPAFKVQLNMGGTSATNRVEFEMPGVILQIPAVNVADVVATTINFSAQGFDPAIQVDAAGVPVSTFDITKNNDLTIRYFAAVAAA